MGRIQADTGLITGINITDTVTKLMALASKPRDALKTATSNLQKEQAAVTKLSALLLGVQYIAKNLGKADIYAAQTVSSSDSAALTAAISGTATLGTYQYTPLRTAQSQQWLSSGMKSSTEALGGGTLTLRYGDRVDRSARLEVLGAGQGISRGKVRITDRSGASAVVDLSTAQTVDDVLNAINTAGTINVTAVADGRHFRLVDRTGQAVSNLKVQEVGNGTTAASLGLAGIDAATAQADGQDVLRLYGDIDLDVLNDGAGVARNNVLDDIEYTLRDGTTGEIDLSPMLPNSSQSDRETTLGEILAQVNEQTGGKLTFALDAQGDRLVATDHTTAPPPEEQEEGKVYGTFTLQAANGSEAIHDLGLEGTSVDGTINGTAILGGLKTVLLSSLDGGQGLGALGSLQLTDRTGRQTTVDLSGAETLDDVIDAINARAAADALGVTAAVNEAGNGLQLVDGTAGAGSLCVAGDAASPLFGTNLSTGAAVLNSGDLHLRVVSQNTRLADLNGGTGVAKGTFRIIDSKGRTLTVDLRSDSVRTVGDAIDAINRVSNTVHARINDQGDGILLEDTGGGAGKLIVTEGASTTGRDLHLLGTATKAPNSSTQVIDGTTTQTIQLRNTDSLTDLQNTINRLGPGVRATILSDGSGKPYRLSLVGCQPGKVGNVVLDASNMGLSFGETVHGQDAMLALGNAVELSTSVLISSSTNAFKNVLPGVNLQLQNATGRPVQVTVATSDVDVVASVKTLVDNYNKFRDELQQATAYDVTTNTAAVLTGDTTALRLDTDLSHLLSSAFYGAGSLRSLADVGVGVDPDGSLTFDQLALEAKYAADPDAVKEFFTTKEDGVADKLNKLLDQIAGENDSLLSSRLTAIQDKISDNQRRIDQWNVRLENEQTRLYTEFYYMDITIGRLKDNLAVLDALAPLEPYTGVKSR